MIESIIKIISIKHNCTMEHCIRVSDIARELAVHMNMDSDSVEKIRVASLLHDVGKVIIDNEILDKKGKLTESEFDLIRHHAEAGYNILKDIWGFEETAVLVRYHHERYDGKGYNLKKPSEIPFECFIIQLADCVDAMSSDRPYQKALSSEEVAREIKNNTGTQFHPIVASSYLDLKIKK